MARRRYRKVTSGSGKSLHGRIITMARPISSGIRDLVESSRSIAHSNDFEGHKSIQTNSWQQIPLSWKYYNQAPSCTSCTASNFLQWKWTCCNKSYWQCYDIGWYRDMGSALFSASLAPKGSLLLEETTAAAEAAAEAGKQQASSRQAENAPLKKWSNILKISAIQSWTFCGTPPQKQWTLSIT